MDPEQRITTLALLGCRALRPRLYEDKSRRYHCVYHGSGSLVHDRLWNLKEEGDWRIYMNVGHRSMATEPWDARLIASIPEELFLSYLNLLSR